MIYTVVGGLLADVVTDFVQGIAVIIGLAVLLIVVECGERRRGGDRSDDRARATWHCSRLADRNLLELIEAWAVPVFGSLLAVEMLSRIQGCRSAEVARNATFLGAGLYLGVGLIPVVLGLAGPTLVPNLEEPEQVVPLLAQQYLSTFGYVLFAGAVISAILSTVGSCLLAAASLVSHNLLVPLMPELDEARKVWCARVGVIVFGVLAYVIALYAGGIYELVATASAFGSAGIFVVGVFGLFSISAARAARMRRSSPEWSSGWPASTCSSGRRRTSSRSAARSSHMSAQRCSRGPTPCRAPVPWHRAGNFELI